MIHNGEIKSYKESLDFSKFSCLQCNTSLKSFQINENEMMLTCENKFCLFPFNTEIMSLFIFDKRDKKKNKEAHEKICILLTKRDENINNQNSTNISNNSYDQIQFNQKTLQPDSPLSVNNILGHHIEEDYNKEINLFGSNSEDFFTMNS